MIYDICVYVILYVVIDCFWFIYSVSYDMFINIDWDCSFYIWNINYCSIYLIYLYFLLCFDYNDDDDGDDKKYNILLNFLNK